MATITKKQFLSDVAKEVEALKVHATATEKDRLDFKRLNPMDIEGCIYGQMSGDCTNKRAHELMDLACTRVFKDNILRRDGNTFSDIRKDLNGRYEGQDWFEGMSGRRLHYLSALEGYINLNDAKNADVIAYIKGETDKLVL